MQCNIPSVLEEQPPLSWNRLEPWTLTPSLLVLAGSALGGLARFWLGIVVTALAGPNFPWGTLLINVLGSFAIGLTATFADVRSTELRAFVMVGLCGGFTTFSSFSLQSLELLQQERPLAAFAYMGGSVASCLVAAWAGCTLGRA